ncbi:LOW QUALITY PROTEIN: hypothetical protein TorRG33x02_251800 [Trema orientale]|uniref:Uncharacterized protein n=1 Tax=Trema orientale TaxID=63057 RepID=A0A2P5DGE1_TREOI|nr:LOW QUALITY PROTEIN: hypothetical protein TorRG33x02_251800 [Trema orientale]
MNHRLMQTKKKYAPTKRTPFRTEVYETGTRRYGTFDPQTNGNCQNPEENPRGVRTTQSSQRRPNAITSEFVIGEAVDERSDAYGGDYEIEDGWVGGAVEENREENRGIRRRGCKLA